MAVDPKEVVRRLTSTPNSSADDPRELMQRRVATLLIVIACIWGGVLVFDRTVSFITLGHFFPNATTFLWANIAILIHLGIALTLFGLWAALRRVTLSLESLGIVEGGATLFQILGYCAMFSMLPVSHRLTLSLSLGLAHILVLRAAIVPTSPQRTAVIGVLGAIAIMTTSYLTKASDSPPWATTRTLLVLPTFTWSAVTVVATAVISRTIYGLQARVRAAIELGQYTLLDKLGEGGMGAVYRARHALLRRPTAVKLLRAGKDTEAMLGRFEREVQLTANISHPNIVSVYDFGRTPDGSFYYAMEFLSGTDLQRLVAEHGPMPPGRVLRILAQAADALEEAHAVGLVHRDVKPANMILCDADRRPDHLKIFDFGLVKQIQSTKTSVSQVNVLMGTPHYMAPEAITTPEKVDGRADIYALGAVGYYLLTGLPVFEASTVFDLCARHIHEEVVAPSQRIGIDVPAGLEKVILACLAKDPKDRPASAAAVRDALRACTDVEPWTDDDARAWWAKGRVAMEKEKIAEGAVTMTFVAADREALSRASA